MNARTRTDIRPSPARLEPLQTAQYRVVAQSRGLLRCLRFALMAGLDRTTAMGLLGGQNDQAVRLWPSGLFTMLAHAATVSPSVWHRCQMALDRRFPCALHHFECASVFQLATAFTDGRHLWSTEELAGLLWVLARGHGQAADAIAERLAAEFEVAAVAGPLG